MVTCLTFNKYYILKLFKTNIIVNLIKKNIIMFDYSNYNFKLSKSYYLISKFFNIKTENYVLCNSKSNSIIDLYISLKNDIFLSLKEKEEMLFTLFKIKRVYYLLERISFRYRKYRFYNTFDLFFQDFYPSDRVIVLKEDNGYFQFRLYELINIIEQDLLTHENNNLRSRIPRNPYTNKPFSHSSLYNIFYYMKFSHHNIHKLFYLFYNENFNVMKLMNNNYNYLIDLINTKKVDRLSSVQYRNEVNNMLNIIPDNIREIYLDERFPIDIIKKYFNKYLIDYFILKQNTNVNENYYYKNIILIKTLIAINYKNPSFGRLIYCINKKFEPLENFNNERICDINKYKYQLELKYISKFIIPSDNEINKIKLYIRLINDNNNSNNTFSNYSQSLMTLIDNYISSI